MTEQAPDTEPTPGMYLTVLPGPTRKRTPVLYYYRLVYRDCEPDRPGSTAVWEVRGGRLRYQVALERDTAGRYHWHCTCADAVYRAEEAGRVCKHVRGLSEFSPALPPPVVHLRRSA
jgi:hypothetical protein